ncbi:hypothetical protein D3C73_514690 [compost metagenome]
MRKKLLITTVGALILVSGISIGAFASSGLQEIKAFLNGDLKVRVNGEVAQLNDANGKAVSPITYNGTTYLPVRAVAEALDVAVAYDAAAGEVILGERLEGTAIKNEEYNTTLYSKDPAQTTFGDKNYGEVLFSTPGKNIGYTALNPNGKYQKLYLQFAAIEKEIESVEITNNDTNALLKKVGPIATAEGMQTIEVDIAGVKNIAINVKLESDGGFVIPLTTSYYK